MAKVHPRPSFNALVMTSLAAASLGYALHARAVPVPFPEAPLPGNASFSTFSNTVRALLILADTIYVGGNFRVTEGSLTRTNLAAFDLNGNLKAEFLAEPNDTVLALATDGKSLFVGGAFTRLELSERLAAVDLTTGAVVRPFNAHVDGQLDPETPCSVRALTIVRDDSVTPPSTRLIVGGNFTRVDSVLDNRAGLAALLPESGDLDSERFTDGVSGGYVDALLATATTLYAGGTFTSVQSRTYNLASFDLNGTLRTPYSTGGQQVLDLDIDPVSNRLFAAVGGTSNRAMAFDANARTRGSALWQGPRTGGNVQGIHFYAGNVYIGFHDGLFAEPDPYKLAALDAATGALEVDTEHAGLPCENTETRLENCWLPTLDN
ncbi:MAG TPA: hypothetical protein VIV60_25690, partial [Polyangiaceae bacterium]